LPTQPVPQSRTVASAPRNASGPPPAVSLATLAGGKNIQLPTQPVPLAGMVNGVTKADSGGQVQTMATATGAGSGMYIAVDASTGLSYKLEMPSAAGSSGQVTAPTAASVDTSDPLAAIMNETIFTDTSGGKEINLLCSSP